MNIKFSAVQTVELLVPQQPIQIQHYLRQPQRLIGALVDPSRMEQLSSDSFRLKMLPLSFLTLSIQPTVDLQLRTEANGATHLRSIASEIRGIEYINQRFHLNLVGQLAPYTVDHITYLIGKAELEVQVDLPPALWFTPKPLLEATGNGLLRSVLLTIKQRLAHQLLQDYRKWVIAQTTDTLQEPQPDAIPLFSPNSF
jgi:Protein of unknown function (DUF1997)